MTGSAERASARSGPPGEGMPWTVLQLVTWSAEYLARKGVESARLDAEHLLADTLRADRLSLYLDFDRPLTPDELSRFKPMLLERARRKPLQYILGRAAFRDLELKVDSRVLIPRPETEELVEAVLAWSRGTGRQNLRALDVGTGSGAIALSLAKEGPFARVVATDSSDAALELARENAGACGLEDRVELRLGASIDPISPGERFDVVISNPPYVAEQDFVALAPEVREWEPREALVGGEDGLSVLRDLVFHAPDVLERGGLLALEVGAGQASVVARHIRGTVGFGPPEVLRDLGRIERVVLADWRGRGEDSTGAETLATKGSPSDEPASGPAFLSRSNRIR